MKNAPLLLFAAVTIFAHRTATAQEVSLGTDNNFAVLAASTVTDAGAGPTVINGGDVGLYPGTSITGFPPATITPPGTMQVANGVAMQAQQDLTTAYNQAAGLSPSTTLSGTIGTLTLTPGVYTFTSSALLTGTLTLNDEGLTDPVFVFKVGSSLTTATGASIVEENAGAGAIAGTSIFWQVGSSATLGTGTDFDGNILAYTSITDDGGSTVDGRLLAMGGGGVGGAVTLDDTTINTPPAEQIAGGGTVPDGESTFLLLGFAAATLFGLSFRSRLNNHLP